MEGEKYAQFVECIGEMAVAGEGESCWITQGNGSIL